MASPSPTPPSLSPTPHPSQLHQPPAQQSKRDKRRTALSEKLFSLTNSFHTPANPRLREMHYRNQIQALQTDMQLITSADISSRDMRLLDDSGDAVQREVDGVLANMGLGELTEGRGREINSEGLAGRWYSGFLEAVNNAMEDRDTQLTLLQNQHRTKTISLAAQHTRALIHAREEHKSLANTIQLRLSSRLKATLKKLAVEKESSSVNANALSSLSAGGFGDIAENNALHLHPSQFGLVANIGSPRRHGGHPYVDDEAEKETNTRRKPRRRAGEVEELLAFGVGMNFDNNTANGKRKRGTRAQERGGDEGDIPTPPAAPFDMDSPSTNAIPSIYDPADKEANKKRRDDIFRQVYAPVYAIEKLFTDKELQLHANQATLATFRYFSERSNADEGEDAEGSQKDHDGETPTGANTPVPPQEQEDQEGEGSRDREGRDDRERERYSPLSELTRGLPALPSYSVNTRSNPPRAGLNNKELDSLVLGGVPGVGMSYVNKAGVAPPPPGLRNEDADADLAMIRKAAGSDLKRPAGPLDGGGSKKQRRG